MDKPGVIIYFRLMSDGSRSSSDGTDVSFDHLSHRRHQKKTLVAISVKTEDVIFNKSSAAGRTIQESSRNQSELRDAARESSVSCQGFP